jgi:hypothetical protein
MSITFIIRDYLGQVRPLFYQNKELIEQTKPSSWWNFFQSLILFFERSLPAIFLNIFSFRWGNEIIHLPILRPDALIARTEPRISLANPLHLEDLFPQSLSLLVSTDTNLPKTAFLSGFSNAFFLAFPGTLIFLITIRRYWLQGFPGGFRRTIGYRRGETALLFIRANDLRPQWYGANSQTPIRANFVITSFLLWETLPKSNSWKQFAFGSNKRLWIRALTPTHPKEKTNFFERRRQRQNLVFIFLVHLRYAWTEQRTFFSAFKRKTLDVNVFAGAFFYSSQSHIASFSYGRGLLLGGLFFDCCFRARFLRRIEGLFSTFRCHPLERRQRVQKWTRRFILSCLFRRASFYTADHLVFSPLGFSERDSELSRRVTRNAFSYPMTPGKPVSILIEGRNVIGEDSYGRPAPDIVHEPVQISRLAVEVTNDLVDGIYRTQQIGQRVDVVYLGAIERKLSDWLSARIRKKNPVNERDATDAWTREKRSEQKAIILAKEPVRSGFGPDATLRDRSDLLFCEDQRERVARSLDRFVRWLRVIDQAKKDENYGLIGFPLSPSIKVPEALFALSSSHFMQQPYLASVGMLEPQRAIRYADSTEFSRKRNARRSTLHFGTTLRCFNLLIITNSKIEGFVKDHLTRQRQHDLYRARITIHNYIVTSCRYSELGQDILSFRKNPKLVDRIIRRSRWQRELSSYLFGGDYSCSANVYSQQCTGNLQLVQRLFSISWSSKESIVPFRFRTKEKFFLRRKISLDQKFITKREDTFEHEELGKVLPLKIENGRERKKLINLPTRISRKETTTKIRDLGDWVLLARKICRVDQRVESRPLYVGFDQEKHALVMCNRYLPIEWTTRTKLLYNRTTRIKSDHIANLKSYSYQNKRIEFSSWPQSPQNRRIHLYNVRYNRRTSLQRRICARRTTEFAFMSRDRSFWRQKTIEWDSSLFEFWINPKSEAHQKGKIGIDKIIRSSQKIPFSLEQAIRPSTYVPGDLQPSTRGGLVWPGTELSLFIPQKFYHPGLEQRFTLSSSDFILIW